MESAFLRMWDVPHSVIFCSSCILMLPAICCTYFPNPFLISTMTPITTGIVVAFIPHILSPLISRSFSYFNWSVLFSGDGHMNEQAACFVFVLDYYVWSLAFLLISVVLAFATRLWCCLVTVWGSCSFHFSFVYIFISLQMFQWRYEHSGFVVCVCKVFGIGQLMITGHPARIWWIVSWNWPQILYIGSVPSFRILLQQ